ncbi:MAG: HlyC/CorC family transporter [Planctomycetia bacterium]|nr:HlyC/CorC family transporter [Planctomycetia bacterium]
MTAIELIFVLFLVLANGFFVAAEFALVKVRLSQIEQLSREGSFPARVARSVLQHLDAYLSACQLGITLASLGLGWFGEDVGIKVLEPALAKICMAHAAHYLALPLAFVLITFLHISLGEQAPKIMAIRAARQTALVVALPLTVFYKVLWPFIWVLHKASDLMLRLIGVRAVGPNEHMPSEDELRLILAESAAGGEVSRRERLMMENVLDLEDKVTRQVMVPRRDIIYLSTRRTSQENLAVIAESQYTRFPLCDGDLDRVIGMVHTKDVLGSIASGQALPALPRLSRKLPFFPETMRLDVLLREFQRNRTHVAMVVDEYGTVSGMVTFEDVLEELVGPIQDEFDRELPMILRRNNGRFLVDALCPLDELVEACHLELPKDVTSDTTGGLIVELLGHIPQPGEKVRLGRHELTVLDAESTRVRRVEVQELEPDQSEPPAEPAPGETSRETPAGETDAAGIVRQQADSAPG